MHSIDINCDLGEAFGAYCMPQDDRLFEYISSANIACGFHAGDPSIMQATVYKALQKGVAIGAHPGLPDLQGFGRRNMKISEAEAYQMTIYQIGALYGFVKASGGKLHHVKPHGALYNMATKDERLARAIAQAVYDFDASLLLYGLAGSALITAAKNVGLHAIAEVFADRTYQSDGSLTPRDHSDALITNPQTAINQVMRMIKQQEVISFDKKNIPINAETLCIHGDHEEAIKFAKLIREYLSENGITIKAP